MQLETQARTQVNNTNHQLIFTTETHKHTEKTQFSADWNLA